MNKGTSVLKTKKNNTGISFTEENDFLILQRHKHKWRSLVFFSCLLTRGLNNYVLYFLRLNRTLCDIHNYIYHSVYSVM